MSGIYEMSTVYAHFGRFCKELHAYNWLTVQTCERNIVNNLKYIQKEYSVFEFWTLF